MSKHLHSWLGVVMLKRTQEANEQMFERCPLASRYCARVNPIQSMGCKERRSLHLLNIAHQVMNPDVG